MAEDFSAAAACEVWLLLFQQLNPQRPLSSLGAVAPAPLGPKQGSTRHPFEAPFTAQHPSAMARGADGLLSLPNLPKRGCPLHSILSTQPVPPYRGENSFTAEYNHAGPCVNG